MSKARTIKEARRRYPRGSYADFNGNDFIGHTFKVWSHSMDRGVPVLEGYLYHQELDEDGNVTALHPVLHQASGVQRTLSGVELDELLPLGS